MTIPSLPSLPTMIGEYGVSMIHLAWRTDSGSFMKNMQFRLEGKLGGVKAKRVGSRRQ
jgi:hypothetical protein